MNEVSQSIALVTGANDPAGLGFGIAEALLAEGAIVYFGCRLDQQVRALAEPLKRFESRARAVQLDVSDPVSIARAFVLVESESSRLDILVNNAGDGANCAAIDETAEQWDRIMTANARGSFLCSQAAARLMLPQRFGRIQRVQTRQRRRGGKPKRAMPPRSANSAGCTPKAIAYPRILRKR